MMGNVSHVMYSTYNNSTGLIYMGAGTGSGAAHIDLWNKTETGSGFYDWPVIWFWPIK